jgi:hypothetical protein
MLASAAQKAHLVLWLQPGVVGHVYEPKNGETRREHQTT